MLIARVVQGVATGAAAGAVGAGMLDIDRARGTVANAVAPMLGTATGGLMGGLMAQHLPAPTVLVYLVFAAIFLLQAGGRRADARVGCAAAGRAAIAAAAPVAAAGRAGARPCWPPPF